MKRLMAMVAALAFVLAACGDDDDQTAEDDTVIGEIGGDELTVGEVEDMQEAMEDLPACEELYVEGNVLTEDEMQNGCLDEDGDATVFGVASYDCDDGRKLMWHDRAWWFEGEGVHPYPEGADERVPPDSAMDECMPS